MSKKRGMEDPFNDVSKYSQKYKKQRRKVPQLDARPYIHELFPLELHLTLGIDPEEVNGKKKAIKKKLQFSALDTLDPLGDLADGAGSDIEEGTEGADAEGAEKKKGGLLRGLLGEEAGDDEDEEQEPEEEEIEDDFGDDEEGDYNAEQYFDDGDDIGDDWGDEGGAEDYY
jgi:DNA-directed RNA polymerase III subunit RPC7